MTNHPEAPACCPSPGVCYAAKEIKELREMVLDLFAEGCSLSQPTPKYDHCCMATYEDAQEKLLEWGMIKREDCVR